MDKIQAQRAVFQLRRKAVNSAKPKPPVNNESSPRQRATSDVACADVADSNDPRVLIKVAHQHWFGIGWPEDAKPVALLERALELLADEAEECRACDGRGWIVTNKDTDNEVVQGTRACHVCQPSVSKADADCTGSV